MCAVRVGEEDEVVGDVAAESGGDRMAVHEDDRIAVEQVRGQRDVAESRCAGAACDCEVYHSS